MRKILAATLAVVVIVGGAWFLFGNSVSNQATTGAQSVATKPKILRVGLVALPPDRGYPYNSTGIPTIYTYRAIFDGLTFVTDAGEVLPVATA